MPKKSDSPESSTKKPTPKIKNDDYILVHVEWNHGFKHTLPCRGRDLKGILELFKSFTTVKSYTPKVVTEKQYQKRLSW